ncbi:MAG: hypothetical protein IKS52_11050, partial [Clostridia bacterium]|nr:hypothetical protein [Clostridia bacterium]
ETEIHHLIDPPQQMFLRYHLLQYHDIHLLLSLSPLPQHVVHPPLHFFIAYIRHCTSISLLVPFGFFRKKHKNR